MLFQCIPHGCFRIYTITESSGYISTRTTQLSYHPRLATEKPPEHMTQHQRRNNTNISRDVNNAADFPSQQKSTRTPSPGLQQIVGKQSLPHHHPWGQAANLDYHSSGQGLQDSKAYTNEVYMNQHQFQKARQAKLQEGAALGVAGHRPMRGVKENMLPLERTVSHPKWEFHDYWLCVINTYRLVQAYMSLMTCKTMQSSGNISFKGMNIF